MTAISKAAVVDIDPVSEMTAVQIPQRFSGASFDYLDPVGLDTDGNVIACAADSVSEKYIGFALAATDSIPGKPVAVVAAGAILQWLEDSDSYVPGTYLYVGAAGGLDDAATPASPVVATMPVAIVISTTQILVLR